MTHLAPFATERALALVVFIPSLDTAAAILSVAEALQLDLAQGFQIDASASVSSQALSYLPI